MALKKRVRHGAGLGVDFGNGGVIDPTENVKALSEALSQRQDDLRDLNNKYLDARLESLQDMAILRSDHAKEIREVDIQNAVTTRQVDIQNAAATAAQLLAGVQTLATTAATTAETLRNQVATTALQATQQRAVDATETNKRLSAVELALSEGKGKQTVADPALERLAAVVEKLSSQQSQGTGKTQGVNSVWIAVGAVISALGGMAVIAAFWYAVLKH